MKLTHHRLGVAVAAAVVIVAITAKTSEAAPVGALIGLDARKRSAAALTQAEVQRGASPAITHPVIVAARFALDETDSRFKFHAHEVEESSYGNELDEKGDDEEQREQKLEIRVNIESVTGKTLGQLTDSADGLIDIASYGKLSDTLSTPESTSSSTLTSFPSSFEAMPGRDAPPASLSGEASAHPMSAERSVALNKAKQAYNRLQHQWRLARKEYDKGSEEVKRAYEAQSTAWKYLNSFSEYQKVKNTKAKNYYYNKKQDKLSLKETITSKSATRKRARPEPDPRKTGDEGDPDWQTEAQLAAMTPKQRKVYLERMRNRRLRRGLPALRPPGRPKGFNRRKRQALSELAFPTHDNEHNNGKLRSGELDQTGIRAATSAPQWNGGHRQPAPQPSLSRQDSLDEDWINNVLQSPDHASNDSSS